ncbi:MAG TPA: diacylglycerol kinase family protein [Chthoniobacterales bacterium]
MTPHRWKHPAVVLNSEAGAIAGSGSAKLVAGLHEIFIGEDITGAEIEAVPGSEIENALQRALNGPADIVIIGGGDGTVASAVTLMAGRGKPLGILPLGTFNLAARDLGMPLDWKEATLALIDAPALDVDLLEMGGRLYFCLVILGFYPTLVMTRPKYRGNWFVKSWKLGTEMLASVAAFPPLHLTFVNEEGMVIHQRSRIVLIANNDYEELFGLFPRRKSLDAGYFTVYISTHRTRWGLIRSFLAWVIGRWKQDREVSYFHATDLEISVQGERRLPVMSDGEISKHRLPLRIVLRPKAIRVLAPRLS